jgi:hypothetical protein
MALLFRTVFLVATLASAQGLRVGSATRVITPDLEKHAPVYIAGFGNNRLATGVHDDLYSRCMAFQTAERGSDPLIVCGVDSIGLFWEDILRVRKGLSEKKVRYSGLVIGSSHCHQAPDTMGLWGTEGKTGINESYNTLVVDRTVEAAAEAVETLQPATLRIATVRDPELDTFIEDDRPPRRHDSDIIAVEAADAATGKTIATMLNWANHPETLGSRNTLITSDYVAKLRTKLESLRGGMVVFVNGAVGGMQSPLNAKMPNGLAHRTFEKADYIGSRVAELTAKGLEKAKPVEISQIEYREKILYIPLTNPGFQKAMELNIYAGRKPLNKDGTTTTIAGMFRFRSKDQPVLECATVPGELYPELSRGGIERYSGADFPDAPLEKPIKGMMTATHRMLIGLANDEIGYIIPKAEWDEKAPWLNNNAKRWYGEVNSIGPEAAPSLARAIEALLH